MAKGSAGLKAQQGLNGEASSRLRNAQSLEVLVQTVERLGILR